VKDLNIRNVKHEKAAMEKYAEKCIFVNTWHTFVYRVNYFQLTHSMIYWRSKYCLFPE
jgi:hypothetical protein